jgi:type IV secretory pathway ATPase VirB11/archaellum biosynthesis ATPase/intein/homing endonuclease/ferredoxin
MYQRKTGSWGAPPKCAEVCPVGAIKYEAPRGLLWLRLAGVEIASSPPPNAEHVEDRLGRRISVYRVPGEAQYLYWFNLPRLPTKGKNLSEFAEVLLDNKMASMMSHICDISDRIVDVSHLRQIKYITEEEYKTVEMELKRGVIERLPTADGLKYFEHGANETDPVIIRYGRDDKGQLALKIKEKDKPAVTIPFTMPLQDAIADIVESLTHGPSVLKRLLEDGSLEEIEINGVSSGANVVPIWVFDKKYGHMKTNLIPRSLEKMKTLADKLVSYAGEGLKLDPTHQIIDATLPGGERINVIGPERAAAGISMTIRKFVLQDVSPVWFCRPKGDVPPTISIEGMAVLWQVMEAGCHFIVGGATASGKTTVLNVTSEFIPPSDRVIIVQDVSEILPWQPNSVNLLMGRLKEGQTREDAMGELITASLRMRPSRVLFGELRGGEARSLRGAEDVLIVNGGLLQRTPIKDLEGTDLSKIYAPTIGSDYKASISKVVDFVRHPPSKDFVEITTRTGRKVTVTPFHSVFTVKNSALGTVKAGELRKGDRIVVPNRIPCGYNNTDRLDILGMFKSEKLAKVVPDEKTLEALRRSYSAKGASEISRVAESAARGWLNGVAAIPIQKFMDLAKKAEIGYDAQRLRIRLGTTSRSAVVDVDEGFCKLLGHFLAGGNIRKEGGVQITNKDSKILGDIKRISRSMGLSCSEYAHNPKNGGGQSRGVVIQGKLLPKLLLELGCGSAGAHKRVPPMVYGLSENKIKAFLSGAYAGGGNISGGRADYYAASKEIAEDMLYLLLTLGIVGSIRRRGHKSGARLGKRPVYRVSFCDAERASLFNSGAAMERRTKCSRNNFGAETDIYLDTVVKIRKMTLKYPEPSFDLSVNPVERFVGGFGGILLKNTYYGPLLFGGGASKGSATTMHIDSVESLVERVRFKPMEVPAVHLLKLDFIVEARRVEDPFTRKIFRCITRFSELNERLTKEGEVTTSDMWKYYEDKRDFLPIPNAKSRLYREVMGRAGMSPKAFLESLEEKCLVLHYLYDLGVDSGTEFMKYMSKYYSPSPEGGEISAERRQLLEDARRNVSGKDKERVDKILKIVATQLP